VNWAVNWDWVGLAVNALDLPTLLSPRRGEINDYDAHGFHPFLQSDTPVGA
jgi:hypothetical protein